MRIKFVAKDIVVTPEPATVIVTPFFLHHYAEDFLAAAMTAPMGKPYSPVRYYLVCHAIEVAFKALCRARGEELDDLRKKLGHDLEKGLNKARGHGLETLIQVTKREEDELIKANDFYAKKGFEYITYVMLKQAVYAYKGLPDLTVLMELAQRLVDGLKATCKMT